HGLGGRSSAAAFVFRRRGTPPRREGFVVHRGVRSVPAAPLSDAPGSMSRRPSRRTGTGGGCVSSYAYHTLNAPARRCLGTIYTDRARSRRSTAKASNE